MRDFGTWKKKHEGKVLTFVEYDECTVDFGSFYDEWVTFGRKPDFTGFWTGYVKLGYGQEVLAEEILRES